MYEIIEKVRYSETDATGTLAIPALLNYFQDCTNFQSEELGLGFKALLEHNLAWVLSSWQVCINRMPELAEGVKIQTWPTDFKGFFGTRNFCLRTWDDEVLAYANSIWVMIDTKTGKPARIPEMIYGQYENEPPLPMECSSRKIALPLEYVDKEPIPVHRYFIDTNQHVNNEKYVMLAQEFLPEDFAVREVRVEYRKAAVLSDILYPRVTEEKDRVTVNLADEAGNPYAVVLFLQ